MPWYNNSYGVARLQSGTGKIVLPSQATPEAGAAVRVLEGYLQHSVGLADSAVCLWVFHISSGTSGFSR